MNPTRGVSADSLAAHELRRGGRLAHLAKEAANCTRCPLYKDATQVVFGEGPADAQVMMIGEQPGDWEDRTGRPFVGPRGVFSTRLWRRSDLTGRRST